MDALATKLQETSAFYLVLDDRCPVVRNLALIIKQWDRGNLFTFLARGGATTDGDLESRLLQDLDKSEWSLLLAGFSGSLDSRESEEAQTWHGPEAIPIILTHLPFGKIFAVGYLLPGTMWLTRQLYMLISRNRRRFSGCNEAVRSSGT